MLSKLYFLISAAYLPLAFSVARVALIASAGVDHLPPALFASEIPLCRVIDEDFRHGMFEYALWSVLWFQRHFDRALAHQRTQTWKLYPQRAAADFHIGIMGLGEIGGYIADQLARLGYRVSGWSRSEKQLAGVTCYRGAEALDSFLGSLDGLINLLPLTALWMVKPAELAGASPSTTLPCISTTIRLLAVTSSNIMPKGLIKKRGSPSPGRRTEKWV